MSGSVLEKPKMRAEAGISIVLAPLRLVFVNCEADSVADLEEFGKVHTQDSPGRYVLEVDPRFSFREVVDYLAKTWGQQSRPATLRERLRAAIAGWKRGW